MVVTTINAEKPKVGREKIPQMRTLWRAAMDCPIWVKLFLFAILLPTEFSLNLGSLRLSPYKIVLLIAFLPSIIRFVSQRDIRFNLVDFFVVSHLLWTTFSFSLVHGFFDSFETIGSRILEFGGAYIIARVSIRSLKHFDSFIACSVLVTAILCPFLIFESITGHHSIHVIASAMVGKYFYVEQDLRLGLTRAIGSFDHPILMGVFSGSFFCLIWARYAFRGAKKIPKFVATGIVFISTVTSLSSASLLVLAGQIGLLGWNRILRKVRQRWWVLVAIIVTILIGIEFLSNRSALKVLISYLTFSTHTAYYRLAIYDAGMNNVWGSPIIGIGMNDWVRPAWLAPSVDSFWLVQAMQFGIPGFVTLAAVVVEVMRRSRVVEQAAAKYRLAWVISLVSVIVAGFTVHYWNSAFVSLALSVGAGVWFSNEPKKNER